MFIFIGIEIPIYSFSFFIPAIVNGMGFNTGIIITRNDYKKMNSLFHPLTKKKILNK